MPRRSPRSIATRPAALAVATTIALIAGGSAAPAAGRPVAVVDGPEDQRAPSVDDTFLIWTQNSVRRPKVDHAYAEPLGSDQRFRLDGAGTRGVTGGIDPKDPSTHRAIYQQIADGDSDLYWYDLDDRIRTRISQQAVNTARWERDPRVSATYLFFARDGADTTRLVLFERGAAAATIATYDRTTSFVVPGSVGDRYATWTVCGPFSCNVWWYDAQAADPAPTKLKGDGQPQYAPAIDETDGWIYFVRSAADCGVSVGIWRRPWPFDPGDAPTRVRAFKAGNDVAWTLSLDRTAAPQVNLWFSRYRCAEEQGDVVKLPDAGAA